MCAARFLLRIKLVGRVGMKSEELKKEKERDIDLTCIFVFFYLSRQNINKKNE